MSLPSIDSPAIFSHLIVIGVDSVPKDIALKDIEQSKFQPSILEIYLPTDAEPKHPPIYLNSLSLWVFPDGFKILNENEQVIYNNQNMEKYIIQNERNSVQISKKKPIHSFVLTDENYQRRYCSALCFYESVIIRTPSAMTTIPGIEESMIFIPKAIIMISEIPCLDAQKQLLKQIHKSMNSSKGQEFATGLEKYVRIPMKYIRHVHSLHISGFESILMIEESKGNKSNSLASELGPVLRESKLNEFYISAAFSLLPENKSGHECKERVILELRDWMKKKGSERELFRFRIPKNIGIEIPTSSFKPLFQRLSARNAIRILKCILLERQIIFFSSQPNEIPYITEALLSLLWPLKWCCLYVPNLPITIWETLHAVMPYIVGVSSQYKDFIAMNIDFMDKIVVDLDNDALYIGEDPCDFPKQEKEYLISKLEEVWSLANHANLKKTPEFLADLTLKAKHYMNTFLLMLMNNYFDYYKSPSRKLVKGKNGLSAAEIFDFQAYFSQFNQEHQDFLQEAQHSMLFIHLLEETYDILFNQASPTHKANNQNTQNSDNAQAIQGVKNLLSFLPLQIGNEKNPAQNQNTISRLNDDAIQKSVEGISLFNNYNQGVAAFVKEVKGIVDTFGRREKTFKKIAGYINMLDPMVINYIEIVHGCLHNQAMNQYLLPERIDLLPYLAKYYCNLLIDDIDEQMNPPTKNEKSIEVFQTLDKQRIAMLNNIFLSFIPTSISSISSPFKANETSISTPTRRSCDTLEVLERSHFHESFFNPKINKCSEPHQISLRITNPKLNLEKVPRRVCGPRLIFDTPKRLNNSSWIDTGSLHGSDVILDPLDLKKTSSLDKDPYHDKKEFSSQNSTFRAENLQLTSHLSHKRLESKALPESRIVVLETEWREDSKDEDIFIDNIQLSFSRATSEKISISDHGKSLSLTHAKSQEPLNNTFLPTERDNTARERRRKRIFDPPSPEREEIKSLKNTSFGLNMTTTYKHNIPLKENILEKENKLLKNNQKRLITASPWDNHDMSLWDIIVKESEKKRNIIQDKVIGWNGMQTSWIKKQDS